MSNITHLPDKDITQDPLRIIDGDEYLIVAKPGGDHQAIFLSEEEQQFLLEELLKRHMMWTGPEAG